MFLHVGTKDPSLNTSGRIDFQVQRTISAWKKIEYPPHQVKSIPVQVSWQIYFIARHFPPDSVFLHTVADMIIIALFFLSGRVNTVRHHPVWPLPVH